MGSLSRQDWSGETKEIFSASIKKNLSQQPIANLWANFSSSWNFVPTNVTINQILLILIDRVDVDYDVYIDRFRQSKIFTPYKVITWQVDKITPTRENKVKSF